MVKIRKDFIIKTDESTKLSSKVEEIRGLLNTLDNDPTNKDGDVYKSRYYGLMFDTTTTKYYVVFTDAIKTEYGISENYVEYGVNVDIDNKLQTLIKDTVNASKNEIQTALTTNLETKTKELQTSLDNKTKELNTNLETKTKELQTTLTKEIEAQNTIIETKAEELHKQILENRGNFRGVVTKLPEISRETNTRNVEWSSEPYEVPVEPRYSTRDNSSEPPMPPEESTETFYIGDIVLLETDQVFYIAGNDFTWYPISEDKKIKAEIEKLKTSGTGGSGTVSDGDTVTAITDVKGAKVTKIYKKFKIVKADDCVETVR